MAGSSGAGKTSLFVKLVRSADAVMTRTPDRLDLFFSHGQRAYEEMKKTSPCPVVLHRGGPGEDYEPPPGTLVVVDDLQATHSEIVSQWFTRKSHHLDCSIIYLVQNVFDKSPYHRSISLNATYLILFRNPRDMSQVSHLDKQVYPSGGKLLTRAYMSATRGIAHSYIVVDFNQSTPEDFRLRNTLFPEEDFPKAYAYTEDENGKKQSTTQ